MHRHTSQIWYISNDYILFHRMNFRRKDSEGKIGETEGSILSVQMSYHNELYQDLPQGISIECHQLLLSFIWIAYNTSFSFKRFDALFGAGCLLG